MEDVVEKDTALNSFETYMAGLSDVQLQPAGGADDSQHSIKLHTFVVLTNFPVLKGLTQLPLPPSPKGTPPGHH